MQGPAQPRGDIAQVADGCRAMAVFDVTERLLASLHAVDEVAVDAAGALVPGHFLRLSLLARRALDPNLLLDVTERGIRPKSGLNRFAEHVPGKLQIVDTCRDPKDDKFLACAVEGHAHYLVTGDKDLLTIRRYRGVAVVNPGQFLLALELHSMEAETLAARFNGDVLAEIIDTIPLDPETITLLYEALAHLDESE